MAAADRVGLLDERHAICVRHATERDGPALLEAHAHDLGLDRDRGIPVTHAHDRLDEVHRPVEELAALALWVAPQMFASVE